MTGAKAWGIDLVGRKMLYAPWPIDGRGVYCAPTEKERAERFGISGGAVRESLLYFEACGGSIGALAEMLDRHAISDTFVITPTELLDADRWYGYEYYFYLQMFCKKLLNRYDWHFGENGDGQLGECHKIWEKGLIEGEPFGDANIHDYAMNNCIAQYLYLKEDMGIDTADLVGFLNAVLPEGFEVDDAFFGSEALWVSAEFVQYVYEFAKLLSGMERFLEIASYESSTTRLMSTRLILSLPKRLAMTGIQSGITRTNNVFDYRFKLKTGHFSMSATMRKDFFAGQYSIFLGSCLGNNCLTNIGAFKAVMTLLFNLKEAPAGAVDFDLAQRQINGTVSWRASRGLFSPALSGFGIAVAIVFVYFVFRLHPDIVIAAVGIMLACSLAVSVFLRKQLTQDYQVTLRGASLLKEQIADLESINRNLVNEKIQLKRANDEAERRLRITEIYTRHSIVNIIKNGDDPTSYKPQRKSISILFADIRDFTTLSEDLNPMETVELLNSYFNEMNDCIIDFRGEIDKLIGDCLMALFDDPDNAVRSAIDMRKRLAEFNDVNRTVVRVNNGIGVNFGEVVLGNIGSRTKMDYTVIGDIVNSASRMEALTKYYGLNIIISEELKNVLSSEHQIRFIDHVLVKGKKNPTRIYEIFDYEKDSVCALKRENEHDLGEAFSLYQSGRFAEALGIYRRLRNSCPEHSYLKGRCADPLLDFYIGRCAGLATQKERGYLNGWNGIYEFLDK